MAILNDPALHKLERDLAHFKECPRTATWLPLITHNRPTRHHSRNQKA